MFVLVLSEIDDDVRQDYVRYLIANHVVARTNAI